MFAGSMADWLMFAGIVAAVGALAAAGFGWVLREPPSYEPEPEPELEARREELSEAA